MGDSILTLSKERQRDWVFTDWGKQMCTYLAYRGGVDISIQEELIWLDKEFGISR